MAGIYELIGALRAGAITTTEAADRLELLLARPVDADALAQKAVAEMGDAFYDADPAIDGYGPDELHGHVVACIATVIREAIEPG